MSTKYAQKTLCFDESKCKYIDEIDQDMPSSSASQYIYRNKFKKEG